LQFNSTKMKKIRSHIKLTFVVFSLIILGCKKEVAVPGLPVMAFISDTGYLYTDTILSSGDTALIGINCTWNGSDHLKEINTYMNNNLVGESKMLDESFGEDLTYTIKITKSLVAKEVWTFEVIDEAKNISKIELTVTTDNSGGPILKINAIIGAQLNPSIGSFYNIANNRDYLRAEADTSQEMIDIIGGYDFNEKSFLSSPASNNLFGAYNLTTWTSLNLTQYCSTTLSANQFKLITNDKLIISSFNVSNAADHIKGFTTNEVYSFKTYNNKIGLILIISPALTAGGFITLDVKIQQ